MTDPQPFPGIPPRLRQARERAGLSLEDLVERVGLNANSWWDAEAHDEELTSNISLAHLSALCDVVGITPQDLLLGSGVASPTSPLSFPDLSEALKARIARDGLTSEVASAHIGWEVKDVLIDPDELWNFTIDGLRDACRFAGISWLRILAALESRAG